MVHNITTQNLWKKKLFLDGKKQESFNPREQKYYYLIKSTKKNDNRISTFFVIIYFHSTKFVYK